jgi:hypothetical protein
MGTVVHHCQLVMQTVRKLRTRYRFQQTMGTEVAIPENTLNTQDFPSVRLRAQGKMYRNS